MVDYCIPVIIVLFCKLLISGVSTLGENTRHNYDGFRYTVSTALRMQLIYFSIRLRKQVQLSTILKQVQLSIIENKYAGT